MCLVLCLHVQNLTLLEMPTLPHLLPIYSVNGRYGDPKTPSDTLALRATIGPKLAVLALVISSLHMVYKETGYSSTFAYNSTVQEA